MNTTPPQPPATASQPPGIPPLTTTAPAFALRLSGIFTLLQAAIARAFLHHPTRPATVIRPLWACLAKATQRIDRLAQRLAAGKLPWTCRRGETPRAAPVPRARDPFALAPLPRTHGWVLVDLQHQPLCHVVATCRYRLETLLAEPGIAELLAIAPAAVRILRPICRMLAMPSSALPPAPRRPRPARPSPPAASAPPRADRPHPAGMPPSRPDPFAGTSLARPPQRSYPSLVDRSGLPRTFRFLKKPA